MLTLVAVVIRYGDAEPSEAVLKVLLHQGGLIAAATVIACPAMLAVLWIAIRMARRRKLSGAALARPERSSSCSRAHVRVSAGLGSTDVFFRADDAGLHARQLPNRAAGGVAGVALDRGLPGRSRYRRICHARIPCFGWSKSFLGPIGAILLTSAVWTLLHTQYSWFFLAQTFLVGLIFGYWRYRAGSTWLPVITHGARNTAVMAQIALMVTDT
jgi:hypothetical protein